MSIVYVILCHNSASSTLDLFRYLFREEDHFVFHADEKAPDTLHNLLVNLSSDFENVSRLESRLCSWGGFSLVDVALRGIRYAQHTFEHWSHLVVLSEQHLPLVSPETIKSTLESDVSYLSCDSFLSKPIRSQEDILHRFSMEYRELPGVGSFGSAYRNVDNAFKANLKHGSQWIVLSNAACKYLEQAASVKSHLEIFSASILADETALQTLLLQGTEELRGKISSRNLTYVAWPHISDNKQMIASTEQFFSAPAEGYLFIRKRPRSLSAEMAAKLEEFAVLGKTQISKFSQEADLPAPSKSDESKFLISYIIDNVRTRIPTATIEQVKDVSFIPSIYITVREKGWPQNLRVSIVCEDTIHYKVLVTYHDRWDGNFSHKEIAGHKSSVLKVRVYGLQFAREIHVEHDTAGFVGVENFYGYDSLFETIESYYSQATRIAEALS